MRPELIYYNYIDNAKVYKKYFLVYWHSSIQGSQKRP